MVLAFWNFSKSLSQGPDDFKTKKRLWFLVIFISNKMALTPAPEWILRNYGRFKSAYF
jgi:hypothetical protein